MATHLAQGEGIVPAADNPLRTDGGVGPSVHETAETVMKEAMESGEIPAEEEGNAEEAEKSAEDLAREALAEATEGGDEDAGEQGDAETEATGEGEGSAEEKELGPLEPPAHWSAEDQEVFRGIGDKKVQEWVQGFAERQVEPLQQQTKAMEPVAKVLQSYDSYLKQLGQPPERVIDGLLQAEYVMRTGTPQQKAQAFTKIARDYGIDLSASAQAGPALPEDVADDPVAQAMNPVLEGVMKRLDDLQNNFQSTQQQAAAQQQQSATTALEAFRDQKDDKGNLLHPYYNEVLPVMEALANQANATGQQPTLEQVYENACMATPAVRAKIESAKQAAAIRERQSKAADKSKASKSVSSSPGTADTSTVKVKPNESVFETAMKAAQAHGMNLP